MSAADRERIEAAVQKIEQYLGWQDTPQFQPCPRCEGKGHHHGFGEHGQDPDWCLHCGGPGQIPTEPGEWSPEDLLREVLPLLDLLASQAAIRAQQEETEPDDQARVVSVPGSQHGDLAHKPTGVVSATAPEWQPIDSAPKDRVVLLYGCEYHRHVFGRGYWFHGVPGDGEGWITSSFYTSPEDDSRGIFTPTHWMPMPAPPNGEA